MQFDITHGPPPWESSCRTRTGPVGADGAVDAQNAPTAPWKTLCVFHELPQGLSNQITHEKPRKAPKWRWETRIDPNDWIQPRLGVRVRQAGSHEHRCQPDDTSHRQRDTCDPVRWVPDAVRRDCPWRSEPIEAVSRHEFKIEGHRDENNEDRRDHVTDVSSVSRRPGQGSAEDCCRRPRGSLIGLAPGPSAREAV